MLPPWIIGQIRKRVEEEQVQRDERPRLEIPLDRVPAPERTSEEEDDPDRGVVVLDLV